MHYMCAIAPNAEDADFGAAPECSRRAATADAEERNAKD